MKGHLSSVHLRETYRKCSLCSEVLSSEKDLRRHTRTIRHCQFCKIPLSDQKHRQDHLKQQHSHDLDKIYQGYDHVCSFCQKRFNSGKYLERHLVKHTNQKPYQCPLCPVKFSLQGGLARHLGEQPFKSDFCPKRFSDKGDQRKHSRVHTGIEPYSCLFCGKGFKFISAMHSHYRTHLREKPFLCQICPKEVAQSTHDSLLIKSGTTRLISSPCR